MCLDSIHKLFKIDIKLFKVLKYITVIKTHDVDFGPMNLFIWHIVLLFQFFIQNIPCLSCCLIDMILQLNFSCLVRACVNFHNNLV